MQPQQLPARTFWDRLGAQLHKPSGACGCLTGMLMAVANARSNSLALAALELREGDHLLELGCGPGRALAATLQLPRLGLVIGLDWSDIMLAQASSRNRAAQEAGRLALVRGNFSELPLIDESADAILAVNVVYFMDSPECVREAYRVLRPDGQIVIYATHGSVMRRWPFAGSHTHRHFDEKELKALLADAGFVPGRIHIADVNAGFGVKGLLAVARKAAD